MSIPPQLPEVARLVGEHRKLEFQADQLAKIVGAEFPDPAAVAATRLYMGRLLADHCTFEDHAIYDRLLSSGDVRATAEAWADRRDHGALAAAFNLYVAEWPVARIAREWPGFRQATNEVLAALAARIAREEASLYAHAARVLGRRAA